MAPVPAVIAPTPAILRLPLELHLAVLKLLDILVMVRWRLVCRVTRAIVEAEIRRSQLIILSHFVPDPAALLGVITARRALVTAECALAFFLRDNSVLCQDLEICVTEGAFEPLLEYLHATYVLCPVRPDRDNIADVLPERDPHLFLIRDPTHKHRRYMRIIRVCAPLAIVGLHRLNNTAMMCMFNADIMSCAYPALTLRRRALIRHDPWTMKWQTGLFDRRRNLLLVSRGFVHSTLPSHLVDPRIHDPPPTSAGGGNDAQWCMGHFGICACNTRHVGDMYSLTVVLDPSAVGWEYLIDVSPEAMAPRLYAWNFPEFRGNCLGAHIHHDRDTGFLNDGITGVEVFTAVFNFQPTFVGAHLVGCQRTLIDWHLAMPVGDSLLGYLRRMYSEWWVAGQGRVGPLVRD